MMEWKFRNCVWGEGSWQVGIVNEEDGNEDNGRVGIVSVGDDGRFSAGDVLGMGEMLVGEGYFMWMVVGGHWGLVIGKVMEE